MEDDMPEVNVQHQIIEWMNLNGHAVWLNEIPPGVPNSHSPTGYRRAANRRTPDIVGTLKGGRAVFIEVKAEKYRDQVTRLWTGLLKQDYSVYRTFTLGHAKETDRARGQAENMVWLNKTGALCMFAFCLEDVQLAVEAQDKK